MRIYLYSFSLILISACTSNATPSLNEARSDGSLVRADESSLSHYFQEIYNQQNNKPSDTETSGTSPNETASSDGAEGSGVSGTNLQETGIDEADLIKTDGHYIYSIDSTKPATPNHPGPADEAIADNPDSNSIRIMESQGADLRPVKRIDNLVPDSRLSGLYLTDDGTQLIATASPGGNYSTSWFYPDYFASQKTNLLFINVKDPANAAVTTELHFEGALIASRRVDDTLYLALRHYPSSNLDPASNDKNQAPEPRLATDFLPSYSINQAPEQPLVTPSDCYLQPTAKRSADIITLVAVELKSDTPTLNSRCFVGSSEALYASTEALYLATTRYNYRVSGGNAEYDPGITTDIHKFSFDALNLEYRGSAEIRGHLGWHQDRKSFRFSEKGGLLRVLTFVEDLRAGATESSRGAVRQSVPTADQSPVLLTILKEDPNNRALVEVAHLPNSARPDPIGLPGERLYASRFIDDRAFLVTFRVTDPIYLLDLSNSADPFVAGALKIDGYSDYFHPISDTLLLGIGKETIPDNRQGQWGDGRGAWYQGVKLSLIDISDPAHLREADKIVLGKRGTEAAVLRDHHGLTGLRQGDTYRVALPVSLYEREGSRTSAIQPWSYYNYSQAGLYRFDISVPDQTITAIPPLVVSDYTQHPLGQNVDNDRSIIMGDDVHYLHWGKFWSQDWAAQGAISGPQ